MRSISRTRSGDSNPAVRPEDARVRILAEEPLDGVGVGVGVEHQPVLLGELDDPPRHGQVGVGPVEVELADGHVAILREPLLHVGDDGLVAHPGRDLAARAVRPELGNDEVGRLGEELLRPLVVRARHQGALDAGLAQERHDLLGRHDAPGVVAVVDVGVDDGQIGGPADGRHGERHDKGDELEHGDITSRVEDITGRPRRRLGGWIASPRAHARGG